MNKIGEGNEDYENAVEKYVERKQERQKLRNNKSAINSRIKQKTQEHQKHQIEERHLNLPDNVKVLLEKLNPENKKNLMASLGKKDGM